MVKVVNLHNMAAGDGQYSISVDDLDSGSYFIRMNANGQKKTSRFMVK